ncbi:MAG: DUF308 domain-containing protein [Clostridia bacterium]|nr:DUF308 domain-containing protein [Clostridia bacterium]
MSNLLKKMLSSYIFDGFLLVAIGVVMLLTPENSYDLFCYTIGGVSALLGLIKIIVYVTNKKGERKALNLLIGVFLFAFGLALVIKPSFFVTAFQVITGIILVYGAILMLIHAYKLRKVKGTMYIMSLVFAGLTAVFAIIVFIDPFDPGTFRVQVHAVSLVIEGLAMITVLHQIDPNEPEHIKVPEENKKLPEEPPKLEEGKK